MRTYVLTLSKFFMKGHERTGEPTNFADKLFKTKIHTIRPNYRLWRERFNEIERGEACLSIRQWEGKPYRSRQVELARLTKDDGIGLEKIFIFKTIFDDFYATIDGELINLETLAANDGLSLEDWIRWFDNDDLLSYQDLPNPLPIIHLTSFRYSKL